MCISPGEQAAWCICSSISPSQELLLGTGLRAFGQSCSALPMLFFAILQPILTSSSFLNLQNGESGRVRSQMRQMRGAEPTHLIQLPLTLVRASLKMTVLVFIPLQRKKGAWGRGDCKDCKFCLEHRVIPYKQPLSALLGNSGLVLSSRHFTEAANTIPHSLTATFRSSECLKQRNLKFQLILNSELKTTYKPLKIQNLCATFLTAMHK